MTHEEAIDIIKLAANEVEWEYSMEYAAAFDEAIEALEKQMPKKPILNEHHYICPNCCDIWLLFDDEVPNKNDSYCPCCGQAIDWK